MELDFSNINLLEEGNILPLADVVNGLASCCKLLFSTVHFVLALLGNGGNKKLFELALTYCVLSGSSFCSFHSRAGGRGLYCYPEFRMYGTL